MTTWNCCFTYYFIWLTVFFTCLILYFSYLIKCCHITSFRDIYVSFSNTGYKTSEIYIQSYVKDYKCRTLQKTMISNLKHLCQNVGKSSFLAVMMKVFNNNNLTNVIAEGPTILYYLFFTYHYTLMTIFTSSFLNFFYLMNILWHYINDIYVSFGNTLVAEKKIFLSAQYNM